MILSRRNFIARGSRITILAAVAPCMLTPLSGCNTDWIPVAQQDLLTLAPILSSVATIVTEATGNGALDVPTQLALNLAIRSVESGLTLLNQFVTEYKTSPTSSQLPKILLEISVLQRNLADLLTTLHVKDVNLINIISTAANAALSVLSAIQGLVPMSTTKDKVAYNRTKTILPSPSILKNSYNSVLVSNGYASHVVR